MNQSQRGGLGRRALALVGAAAIALIGTVAMSTAASAADPSVANIIEGTGSLSIHKHGGDPVSQDAPNGTELPDGTFGPANPALSGVTFTISPVTYEGTEIDLMTDAGWVQAQGATTANVLDPLSDYALGAGTDRITTDGVAFFDDLEYGLYYVSEGVDTGDNGIISPAAPFLVSVPYPHATDSTWTYDVHVYPKNKLNTTVPTKTVAEPTSPKLGDSVVWTITAPVPALATGDTYTSFAVTDALDPRLSLTSTVVTLNGGAPLTLGTDYSMSGADVNFMAGGLTLLNANPAVAKTVTVVHTTTVTSLDADDPLVDGQIVNTALVNTNGSTKTTGPAQINYGPLAVHKQAAQAPNHFLAGAEFKLFKTQADALADTNAIGTYPVDASGNLVINGLFVGVGGDLTQTYYLLETKAPAGYVLPTGAAAVTAYVVNAGGSESATVVNINNTQQNGPNLPLTGSSGTTMFVLGGIALLLTAGGVGLVASSRRRQGTFK